MTLSKERLEEIRDYDTCVTLEESAEMARRLRAAEAQEPVAWRCDSGSIANRHVVTVHRTVAESWVSKLIHVTPLFAAPQPVAVPICPKCGDTGMADSGGVQPWGEEILVSCDCSLPDPELTQLVHDLDVDGNHRLANIIQSMIDAQKVAAQPVAVPDEIEPTIEAIKNILPTANPDEYAACVGADMWNACRAAALNQTRVKQTSGDEPVSRPYKLPQWIPCSERMPELDSRVLLYFADYGGHAEDGCIGDEGDGPYHYFFDGDSLRHEPTHWMPLPAAPQEPTK